MSIPVVTVGHTRQDLVGGLERLHGPVTVVRRCSALAELLAVCQGGLARAAVVAAGSEELTASLVERLQSAGVAVIALADDPAEVSRLRELRAATAATGLEAAELAVCIADAVEELGRRGHAGRPSVENRAEAGAAGPDAAAGGPVADTRAGSITTVWGPTGAPGRSTVAVNLAAEAAAAGREVILVDADTYGASVATMLGLLDESAGIAQACRLADQGLLDAPALLRVAAPVVIRSFQLRVLTGISRSSRWPELRAAALGRVLHRCRELADLTVVDVGFPLESDEELSFDTAAPRRNAAALHTLESADTIYAVGSADSIGVPRLVRGLAELAEAVPGAAPQVLLNKVRPAAVGRSPERQLEEAWERYGPGAPIRAFLPFDPRAADDALAAGSVLLESAPDSGLRRAVAGLVCAPAQHRSRAAGRLATALVRRSR